MNFLYAYEITLKIKETASVYVQILDTDYKCPSEIYINDNNTSLSDCRQINVAQYSPIDKIKLVWNKTPESCSSMFLSCRDITEMDLTNFDTSLVTNMACMFQDCNSLTSVNLSNLDTRNVTSIYGIFQGCSSLTSIDLSNFNTSKINDMRYLFDGCTKLQYINLLNFVETSSLSIDSDMFDDIPKNSVICIKKEKAPRIANLLTNYNISCDFQKKTETINCNLNGYKYEYEGKCYNICLENTIPYNNECKPKTDFCNTDCINSQCIYEIKRCKITDI